LSRGKEIKETVVEFFLNFVDENIFSEAVTGNQQGQPQKKIFIGGHQKDIIEIIRSTIGSLKDIYSHDIGKGQKSTNLANTYIMFANNVGKKLIDAVPNILMTAAQNVSKIIAQQKPAAQAAAAAPAGQAGAGQAGTGQATAGTPTANQQDLSALQSIFTSGSGTAQAAFARMSTEEKNTLATTLAGLNPEEKAYFNRIRNYDNKLKFLRKTAAERAAHMSRPPGPSRSRRQQSTATTINPPQSAPQPQSTPINPAPNTPNSAFGSRITFQPGMFQTSSYNPMKKGFLNFFESRQARNFINETAIELINNSNNVEKLVEEFIQYTKHGSKHSIILESFDDWDDDVTPKARRAKQTSTSGSTALPTPQAQAQAQPEPQQAQPAAQPEPEQQTPQAPSGSPPAASGFQYGRETLFGKETLQKTRFTDINKQVITNLTKVFNKKIQEMPAIDDKRIFSQIFKQVIKSVENQLRTDLQSTVKELEGKAIGSKDEKYGEVIKGNRKKNFNMIMRGLGYSNPEQFLENLGRQMSAGNFSAIGKEVNSLRTKLSEPRYEHNKKLIEEFLKEALGNLDPNEFEKAMRSNSIEGVKDFFKYQAGMLWLAYAVGGELVARYGPSIKSSLMTAANKLGQAGKYIWDKASSAAIGAGEWLSKKKPKAEEEEDLDDDDDDDKDEPEQKKPSWLSRKASSAKDWLKGHFTNRPMVDPSGYRSTSNFDPSL
jgi:hypothetical protein